jgi:hypothetical protein
MVYREIQKQLPNNVDKELLDKKERLSKEIIDYRDISNFINNKCFSEIAYYNTRLENKGIFTNMCMWLKT